MPNTWKKRLAVVNTTGAASSNGISVRMFVVGCKVQSQMLFKHAQGKHDLTQGLKKLNRRTLIFVGDCSPPYSEAIYMSSKMDKKKTALVEVQKCGSLVTEEQPHSMIIPIESFLIGFGFHRRPFPSSIPFLSPSSSSGSSSCIPPELLSPESLGFELKPIRTHVPI